MGRTKPGTVQYTGARAGSRLIGSSQHNKGLLIEVHSDQEKLGKRVEGSFTLVDPGSGEYTKHVERFVGDRFTDARTLIEKVRENGAQKCTHIVNRNCMKLAVEPLVLTTKLSDEKNLLCSSEFRYQVALSFAGEDRKIAKALAGLLRDLGIVVFYDEYEKANLWGKDLYQHLAKVYKDYSQYCVIFASKAYARKTWTRHELQQAQARAFGEHREYILPIQLDDTQIPGIPETVGYLRFGDVSLEQIADLLMNKLSQYKQTRNTE